MGSIRLGLQNDEREKWVGRALSSSGASVDIKKNEYRSTVDMLGGDWYSFCNTKTTAELRALNNTGA
jgi:hypothetical protein